MAGTPPAREAHGKGKRVAKGYRSGREPNREAGALGGKVLDGDGAAHRLGQLADDREAEAGAVPGAAPGALAQVEALEGVAELGRRDAGALVGDRQLTGDGPQLDRAAGAG